VILESDGDEEDLLSICEELIDKARGMESCQDSPLDATLMTDAVVSLCRVALNHSIQIAPLLDEALQLQKSLQLLCEIRINWDRRVSLCTLERVQLGGLVQQYLIETNCEALCLEIDSRIRPVVDDSNNNLDHILQSWVQRMASSTVFDESEEEEDQQVFAKMVICASTIRQAQVRAEVVLLLMQLPSAGSRTRNVGAIEQLIVLAQTVSSAANTNTHDAITEALRIFQLKAIAYRYGIIKFDIRNQQQVRAVVNAIVSQSQASCSIEDALHFSHSWSSAYISSSFLLGRALYYRGTDVTVDDAMREDNLRSALFIASKLDQFAAIVEDAVDCFLSAVDEACAIDESEVTGRLIGEEQIQTVKCCVHSALHITSIYIDLTSGESTGQVSNTITFVLLNKLRALMTLQTEFRVYLTLSELNQPTVCGGVIALLVKDLAGQIAASISKEAIQSPLTPSLRRACVLLSVSPAHLLHQLIKELLVIGNAQTLVSSFSND
jgi:hypothetical protein